MTAWIFGIFDWFAKSRTAQIVALVIGVIIGVRSYGALKARKAKLDERKKVEARHEKAQLKEQAAVAVAQKEVSDDLRERHAEAERAYDELPRFASADELREQRPDLDAIVFGPGGRDG